MKKAIKIFACLAAASVLFGCAKKDDSKVVKLGHFPNISHAQALIAHQLSRQGKGWFESRLGDGITIEWRVYNAGPSAMESMLSGDLDITYVGPSPALNAYAKTDGKDIRILAGSADGGAALLVNPKLGIKEPKDFKGKKIGTPQLGNTQDVACRAWLIKNGMKVSLTSGDAHVIATPNPEQLPLFKSGALDAVWTVEPWVTRLELDGGAKSFLEQKDTVTTVLVSNVKNINERKELIKKFIAAHDELTKWILENPEEAQKLAHAELEALTGGKISMDLIKSAWKRLIFTTKQNPEELQNFMNFAYECGFLKSKPDLKNLFYKE